jgi:hypothetical protein
MSNKKIREIVLRWKSDGLSLIEVLIVIVITGFTLIALLNLAARDLSIETTNEQNDTGNYVSFSQLEEFDNVRTLNPSCLSTIANDYTSNNSLNTYFICSKSNLSIGTLIPQCDNYSGNGTFYVYQATNSPYLGGYLNVVPTGNGFYDCDPAGSTSQANGDYGERLFISSYSPATASQPAVLDIKSQTQWNLVTNKLEQIELLEEYSL